MGEPRQQALPNHVVERLEGEVRVDGARAVAQQQRHVVHFARIARFDHQRAPRALALPHQVMMHARRREQAGNGRERPGDAAIGEDQDGVAFLHGRARQIAELAHRGLEREASAVGVVEERQRRRRETVGAVDVPELRELIVVDHGVLDPDLAARFGRRLQQVAFRTDGRSHRRHQLFTNRVERRVRDLREELLEVVVEQPRPLREHGERGVGAHRADGFLALERHRPEQEPQILVRVAERALPLNHHLVRRERLVRRLRQIFDVDEVRLQPLAVRMLRGQLPLDLFVVDDPALSGVHEQDAARVQPLLEQHLVGGNVEHADLGGHDDQLVLRHVVARGAKAVAIEHGADDGPVRERNRRGSVPGLHQRGMELVERLPLGAHPRVAGPRLGNHHQDGVRQRTASHDQQLEHVVEDGGVAAAFTDDGQNLLEVVAEQL